MGVGVSVRVGGARSVSWVLSLTKKVCMGVEEVPTMALRICTGVCGC
jgi:hypothetical protein